MAEFGQLIPIGIIVIFIGIFLVIFGSLKSSDSSNTKVAVGGFIGFIPFGFANDKRMLWVVVGMMVLMALFWVYRYSHNIK